MRINIYTEELTDEVEVVEKGGFHGLRFYLKSPEELHHDADDDDRSAITFWGLRTVAPLMEKVAAMLRAHREARGLPISVNEMKNDAGQNR